MMTTRVEVPRALVDQCSIGAVRKSVMETVRRTDVRQLIERTFAYRASGWKDYQ